MEEYCAIAKLETCIDELIYRFHLKPRRIRLDARIRGYLLFIFYKLNLYINTYDKEVHEYFKDTLMFQSRHSNYTFYAQIQEILQTKYTKQESAELFLELINHPDIIIYYIYGRKNRGKVIRELSDKSPVFGDPKSSFLSYFKFFEKRGKDWFAKMDSKTSTSEIVGHAVLFEYRYFFGEFLNVAGLKESDSINVGVLRKFVESAKDTDDLETREFNAKTRRWIKKCGEGSERNAQFVCRKTRKNRSKTSSPASSSPASSSPASSSPASSSPASSFHFVFQQ